MDQPRRIAIFRALQLGDMLCAVPALRALRRRFPKAELTLIGLPWAQRFQRRFSAYIDQFLPFPGFPGLPERAPEVAAIPPFLAQVQAQRFDLVLQMHGSGALSNSLCLLFGGRRTVGFYPQGGWCPDPQHFWPYPDDQHEIRRNLALVAQLGAKVGDERLEYPLSDEDRAELDPYPEFRALRAGRYVCLHPGARAVAKRWAPEHFAAVGDALAAQGWQIVLTGSGEERALAQTVAEHMRHPPLNAACDISIGGLAALLAGAALVISNDTGAAHLANALDVPSVVIFFATDPRRWAPLNRERHVVVYEPCGVEPATVLAAARRLLADQGFSSSSSARRSTSSTAMSLMNDSR